MTFDGDAHAFAPRYLLNDKPSLTTWNCGSTASLWSEASCQSDTSSQSSDSSQSDSFSQVSDSSSVSSTSDSDSCDSYCAEQQISRSFLAASKPVASELRQNPRRRAATSETNPRCPPSLVRQSDRKVNFVDSLVDSSTQIVETIWPFSSVVCRSELGHKAVLPLRTFIQETLRRSRTSYSTLQVALYYLILIKPHVPRHNFTTEQPEDRYSDRALQCGRRMFLAALILASKYLQDRNYSARAWSKISGLNTQEINQNEIIFLLAVNWKLHITDDVFQRWTEIVLKYTPPPGPPSPGSISPAFAQQTADWKHIILGLNIDLTNISALIPGAQLYPKLNDLSPSAPRSILNMDEDVSPTTRCDLTPTPKAYNTPMTMEPTPVFPTPTRLAPSLGVLPTPRLTPQSSGFCTPAASAASHILGRTGAMGMAMSHAHNVNSAQYLDRHPLSLTSSPMAYCPVRRSSLANSVSTVASPESMVSDTSCLSRSSSISSSSSLVSANAIAPMSVPPRSRAQRLSAKPSMRPSVPSVPETYDEYCFTSSPDSYTGPVGKMEMAQASRRCQLENMVRDPTSDAAQALHDLHSQRTSLHVPQIGRKRSREMFTDGSLQENVRDILSGQNSQVGWVEGNTPESSQLLTLPSELSFSARKRLCCAVEANLQQDTYSLPRPGMWHGILN